LAWQGIRKRSWQTEQTSSSGGTGDDEAAELIPLFSFSFPLANGNTSRTFFLFSFLFTVKSSANRFDLFLLFPSWTRRNVVRSIIRETPKPSNGFA
jgi:hypothetical protein